MPEQFLISTASQKVFSVQLYFRQPTRAYTIYSRRGNIFCQGSTERSMAGKPKGERKTKKDVLVEMLREAILSGELAPGDRLLQEELAERFDVSPTPVREAIQQLVA